MYYSLIREKKMYKCTECNKTSESGERLFKKIFKTRKTEYVNPILVSKSKQYTDREDIKTPKDKTSEGFEIVQEINVCEGCYNG